MFFLQLENSLISVFASSPISFIVFLFLYVPKKTEHVLNHGLVTHDVEIIKTA
jgi:hypothetical protein